MVGIPGVCVDITYLKQTEAKLRAVLEEKMILLSEVYHRVQNDLQVISGREKCPLRRTMRFSNILLGDTSSCECEEDGG